MSYEDYADLMGTGHESREPVKPEDEFFHSVYIAGTTRKNHINVEELAGKFQVRGVQYNLDEVNLIITHTKDILAKIITQNRKDSIECFSFKPGAPPWYGTSKLTDNTARPCPQTSAERAVNEYCNLCKAQIVVAGIFCNSDGSPVLTDEKKPIFVFIRGKGMKYKGVSDYLGDMFKMEMTPIFDPPTPESIKFEKAVVNNKRFVTNITKGQESSNYGMKDVFILKTGAELPKDAVLKILEVSKNTLEKFNEKFDWSARSAATATGYGQTPEQEQTGEGQMKMESTPASETPAEQPAPETPAAEPAKTEEKPPAQVFSFDDVNFD
jgi:hypothetical protein